MGTKVCTNCKKELEIIHFCKMKATKDGYARECKGCKGKRDKKYANDHKETLKIYKKEYSKVNRESIKEKSKIFRDTNKPKKALQDKRYRETHGEYIKEYRENNKEATVVYNKEYNRINKETIAVKRKIYNKDNTEKIMKHREENKEHYENYQKEYRKNNRDKCNIGTQKYRANKRKLECTLTSRQWEHTKQYFNNKCAYCGKTKPLEREHFIAMSKLGEFTNNNVICACKSCNSSKCDKNFFEWYPTHKSYNKSREAKILKFLSYDGTMQQLKII